MKLSILKILLTTSIFAFFVSTQASAQSTSVQNIQNTTATRLQTSTATGSTLQTKALAEINKRIKALTLALSRIEQAKGLSEEAKQELSTEIQKEITNLNSLKSKIETETDAATVRTLISSVVDSYKNYALFVPKTMILSSAERLMMIADKMSMLQEKILTAVTTSTNGQDISEIETLLTDAQENITAGRESAQAAMEKVSSLEADGYPENRSVLQQARAELVASRTSLSAARKSLGEAVTAWKNLSKGTASTETQGMAESPVSAEETITATTTPAQENTGSEAL